MNHDKRKQYLLFENQTGFFLDQQDFQCFPRRKRVSSWSKLGDVFELKNMILNLIYVSHWYQTSYVQYCIHHSQFHHPNDQQNKREFQLNFLQLVLPLGEALQNGHFFQWKFMGWGHECCCIHSKQSFSLILEREYPFQSLLWTQAGCVEFQGVWVHCMGPNSTW